MSFAIVEINYKKEMGFVLNFTINGVKMVKDD